MTRRRGAPMPANLRPTRHPALAYTCTHCGAGPSRVCRSQSRTRHFTEPHPSRITKWAVTTACCPTCQVEPTVPCHQQGRPLNHAHGPREDEARRTTT